MSEGEIIVGYVGEGRVGSEEMVGGAGNENDKAFIGARRRKRRLRRGNMNTRLTRCGNGWSVLYIARG